MFLTILIVLFALISLMALHELGHFLLARKFGVRVDEFGIGIPPRIFGKKIGKTIYSLNLLPVGAFVKMLGEEERVKNPESFSEKPIWQRALIVVGGVVAFWLIAFLILTVLAGVWGLPTVIDDDYQINPLEAKVQVILVAADSPASEAGIQPADIITFMQPANAAGATSSAVSSHFHQVKQVQDFTKSYLGQELTINLLRMGQELTISVMPRVEHPEDEGPLGVALARIADIKYPWHKAPLKAAEITVKQTVFIPKMLAGLIAKKLRGEAVPGFQVMGPVGIGKVMGQSLGQGTGSFLGFIAMIAIWLALFNLLPIPALDGGKLLFLGIEAVKRKPLSQKIEQKITLSFFILLIVVLVLVTIKDILDLF